MLMLKEIAATGGISINSVYSLLAAILVWT